MKCHQKSCKECQELKRAAESVHACSMECIGQDCPGDRKFKQAYPITVPGPEKPVDTRTFPTGATRGLDDTKLDYEGFLSPFVLERFAQYMHECRLRNIPEGQSIRTSDNWQRGMPFDAYMKSLVRHVVEAWQHHRASGPASNSDIDKRTEDTLCAIIFNAQGYLQELLVRRNAAYRPK